MSVGFSSYFLFRQSVTIDGKTESSNEVVAQTQVIVLRLILHQQTAIKSKYVGVSAQSR
jgi:hypothetical protein